MLFKQAILDRIATGEVTVAFRRWRRPWVKARGTLLTVVGQLSILAVEVVNYDDITKRDAMIAGFATLEELHSDLQRQRAGELYRIRFALAGPDPRVTLRAADRLSVAEVAEIKQKLMRLDASAKHGAWTTRVLALIDQNPERSAGELAALSGYEKEWLKLNVRKLKNLGLTESLNPGYRLSPRGGAYLDATAARG